MTYEEPPELSAAARGPEGQALMRLWAPHLEVLGLTAALQQAQQQQQQVEECGEAACQEGGEQEQEQPAAAGIQGTQPCRGGTPSARAAALDALCRSIAQQHGRSPELVCFAARQSGLQALLCAQIVELATAVGGGGAQGGGGVSSDSGAGGGGGPKAPLLVG